MLYRTHESPWISAASLDDKTLTDVCHQRLPADTPWDRQMQLSALTEFAYRGLRSGHTLLFGALRDQCILDHKSRPEFPPACEILSHRQQLVYQWTDMIESQEFPSWTRRGPPDWLEATLWRQAA